MCHKRKWLAVVWGRKLFSSPQNFVERPLLPSCGYHLYCRREATVCSSQHSPTHHEKNIFAFPLWGLWTFLTPLEVSGVQDPSCSNKQHSSSLASSQESHIISASHIWSSFGQPDTRVHTRASQKTQQQNPNCNSTARWRLVLDRKPIGSAPAPPPIIYCCPVRCAYVTSPLCVCKYATSPPSLLSEWLCSGPLYNV